MPLLTTGSTAEGCTCLELERYEGAHRQGLQGGQGGDEVEDVGLQVRLGEEALPFLRVQAIVHIGHDGCEEDNRGAGNVSAGKARCSADADRSSPAS